MSTTQTPGAAARGEVAAGTGPTGITEFVFETPPSQDEVRTRLAALEAAQHATHTEPAPFCALCPPIPARGCRTCGGDGFTFHSSPTNGAVELDGPCPDCTGRTF